MVLLNSKELKEFFNNKFALDFAFEVKELKQDYEKIIKKYSEDKIKKIK